jgi:D-ribulokinase
LELRLKTQRICISGTSGSALIYNRQTKQVSRSTRMYNFNIFDHHERIEADHILKQIESFIPTKNHVTKTGTSTLAKLLSWHLQQPFSMHDRLYHQADYVAAKLTNPLEEEEEEEQNLTYHISDWHNALKLGYDLYQLQYPSWLISLLQTLQIPMTILPEKVLQPGSFLHPISRSLQDTFQFPSTCLLCAGTTDSIAAFIATEITEEGCAVTSLGSTLVCKTLSSSPVEDASRGIYSHRYNQNLWLVGGAANVGGSILRDVFNYTSSQLQAYSEEMLLLFSSCNSSNSNNNNNNNLIEQLRLIQQQYQYYPLQQVGERFPINDPQKQPQLRPIPFFLKSTTTAGDTNSNNHNPSQDYIDSYELPQSLNNLAHNPNIHHVQYLLRIFYSLAEIEAAGYTALESLGATKVTSILTAGGGAKNDAWSAMRSYVLQRPVKKAKNVEAAYGCALLGCKQS